MENKKFGENEVSEQNKEARQSETRKEGIEFIKAEITHFTDTPKIIDFEAVKMSKNDNIYGIGWGRLVCDYLKTAYPGEGEDIRVVSWGNTYKVLNRGKVTSFYDAAGNTLFDVVNERLEKEYEWLMNSGAVDVTEGMDVGEENGEDWKSDSVVEQTEEDPEVGEAPPTERAEAEEEDITDNGADDDMIPMGIASLKEIVTGLPAPTTEEIVAAKEKNAKPVRQRAVEKLEKERESAKDRTFADPIIEYLLKRCNEDERMAEDVAQEYKTWQKCFDYIYSQARKQAKGNCAAVRDDVVYEWAEDYYHKDDKEEVEKEKKAATVQKKSADKKKAIGKKKEDPKEIVSKKQEKKSVEKKEDPKTAGSPNKQDKSVNGQISMFDFLGA